MMYLDRTAVPRLSSRRPLPGLAAFLAMAILPGCSAAERAASSTQSVLEGGASAGSTSSANGGRSTGSSSTSAPPGSGLLSDGSAVGVTPLDAGQPSDAAIEASLDSGGPALPPAAPPLLSQTGLFASVATDGTLVLQPGVQQYEPAYALWADGASKMRWIYLPPGSKIDTSDIDHWSFPPGTKLWKEFDLNGERLETRLLWIYGSGPTDYLLVAYWWNPEAGIPNDAELADAFLGAQDVNGTTHDIPSQQDCHTCHDSLEEHVLGFGAIELNHTLPGVNIHTLMDAGLLTTEPNLAALVVPGNAVAQAALGYLHTNCGICHNTTPGATGIPTPAMVLRLSSGAATVQDTEAYQTAVNVMTTDFTSWTYRIAGQDPDASAVVGTMEARGSREQMPPLATKYVDDAGMAQVRAWIDTLPAAP